MRIEVGGAQITESVADILDMLQNETIAKEYLDAIDELTRLTIMSLNGDPGEDRKVFEILRVLQLLRHDIRALASPPEVDLPENDVPTASF